MANAGPQGQTASRRLYVYNGGLLGQGRVRRILTLAGWDVRLGAPLAADDWVGVWGKSPTAPRGEAVADALGRPVLRVEDAFLRSVGLGRDGAAPIGLLIDGTGVHFASDTVSGIEDLLARHPLDDGALLARARDGIGRLKALSLSKYNQCDPEAQPPPPGYVLVIDQTKGDASIRHGAATSATFREMLFVAMDEHPGARILVRTHPETIAGHREGHYGPDDRTMGNIAFADPGVSPQALLEGAIAVYTVSSLMGFEAILAGHRPNVFGQPFYAGWGLTDDRQPVFRRQRKLTRAQLFAAAMILYPTWYDPCRDRLCTFEEAVDQLEAEVRAFREDRGGYVAVGQRLWKRGHLQRFFGSERPVWFRADEARAHDAVAGGRCALVWGADATGLSQVRHVEDGLVRSRGLGAELVPPLSLVADRHGLYYDPTRESGLDRLVNAGPPPGGTERARRLIARLIGAGITKYTPGGLPLPPLPVGRKILVPGQVEDDQSVLLGAGAIRTNLALLERVRAENPDATLLYKPHPDVEAGLRAGRVTPEEALRHADLILTSADPAQLISAVDEVWTMTSTLGFEALLRSKHVTCLGAPFYAGWGLTRDLGPAVAHRRARPGIEEFAHAALIAYPRYLDPVSGLPCPAEVVVERLARGQIPRPGPGYRTLAKLQGLLAGHAWLWRG